MERANTNPILDTGMYEVEFARDKVTESIYAQCDVDGNEYLLLDA